MLAAYHICTEWPVLSEEISHSERHGEGAEQKVAQCKVGNEDVSRGQQNLEENLIFKNKLKLYIS